MDEVGLEVEALPAVPARSAHPCTTHPGPSTHPGPRPWPPASRPAQGCHLLSLLLEELGIAAAALHSHKPQRARLEALHRFKSGSVPILLATDVAVARPLGLSSRSATPQGGQHLFLRGRCRGGLCCHPRRKLRCPLSRCGAGV